MKLTAFLSLLIVAFSAGALHGADTVLGNGDFSKGLDGWKLLMPEEAGATLEVVPDGYEGKPALKLVVGETSLEPWQGRISADATFEPGATYTLKFQMMSEPDDSSVEIVAWGRNASDKNSRIYGDRTTVKPTQAWEEFTMQFTVEAEPKETFGITFGNVARANRTLWLANVSVTKD